MLRADSWERGWWYTRRLVTASYTSTSIIKRPGIGISSPCSPFGYPRPSHRSWCV
jgi:hypothetical protein